MSEETQDAAAAMAPGPQHDRFKPFLGTFRAQVKVWMGGGEPMVSTGTMVNTLELGGRYVRQEYTGDPVEGPFGDFEGHGFWGYNGVTQEYEGFWVDNASTIMQFETGTVDESGRIWTMTSEMADPGGGRMARRSVITLEDEDHHSMESFFIREGQEFKGMEIRYTRSS